MVVLKTCEICFEICVVVEIGANMSIFKSWWFFLFCAFSHFLLLFVCFSPPPLCMVVLCLLSMYYFPPPSSSFFPYCRDELWLWLLVLLLQIPYKTIPSTPTFNQQTDLTHHCWIGVCLGIRLALSPVQHAKL